MSDLEKANTQLSGVDVRFLFTGALVDRRIEVLPPSEDQGKGFLYCRSEKKK